MPFWPWRVGRVVSGPRALTVQITRLDQPTGTECAAAWETTDDYQVDSDVVAYDIGNSKRLRCSFAGRTRCAWSACGVGPTKSSTWTGTVCCSSRSAALRRENRIAGPAGRGLRRA